MNAEINSVAGLVSGSFCRDGGWCADADHQRLCMVSNLISYTRTTILYKRLIRCRRSLWDLTVL